VPLSYRFFLFTTCSRKFDFIVYSFTLCSLINLTVSISFVFRCNANYDVKENYRIKEANKICKCDIIYGSVNLDIIKINHISANESSMFP
jgi:hypothetical protein